MVTSQVQLVMPTHVNSSYRLFGGQLMAWIDIVAAVEAQRHTHKTVTTASIDHLDFLAPAHLGDLVRIDARVSWTGRTSLEVIAESYVESLDGTEKKINVAYLVFVALDQEGNPTTFPHFEPQTPQEMRDWQEAELRRQQRQKRKGQHDN